MKKIKIYGQVYEIHQRCKKDPKLYWHDNMLTDEPLDRPPDGYIRMDDGNIVGVYGKKNFYGLLVAVVLVALVTVGGYSFYTNMYRPKPLDGTLIKVAQPGNNEINFNTFVQCNGSIADIRFLNGQSPVKITITGEGIETAVVNVEPNENVSTIPMRFTTKEAAVEAELTVEQEGTQYHYPIMVEIPQNMSTAGGSVTGDVHLISEDAHPFSEEMLIQ